MNKFYISLVKRLTCVVLAGLIIGTLSLSPVQADQDNPKFINGKMAYVDGQPGSDIIWLRNGDGSNPVQFHSSSNIISSPAFSPNGKKIAFNQGTPAEIYVKNIDGTGLINLTNNSGRDEGPAWAPYGDKIAFVSDRGRSTADYRLYMMNSDGTNQIPIFEGASQMDRFPQWSPDGKKIYYNSSRAGTGEDVYVYDTVAQTTTQFTNLPGSVVSPTVSPDGTKVVFAHAGTGDTKLQLYVQNADGTNFKKLFQLCSDQYSQYPLWSPDGRKILFMSECGTVPETKLYMINADGSGSAQLISSASEDVWTKPGWQRVPVSTIVETPGSGIIVVDQDGDHEDVDYEIHPKHEVFIAGKSGNVIVHAEGVLKGTGATAHVTVEANGRLAPGRSPGCLSTDNLVLTDGSIYEAELGGTTRCAQYDGTDATGTISLGNSSLEIKLYNGFVPTIGNTFTIISNDNSDAITGTFSGLVEGAKVTANGIEYFISYVGGDGNDVVLSVSNIVDATAAQASSVPGVPNTGMKILLAKPVIVFAITSSTALLLWVLSRFYESTR